MDLDMALERVRDLPNDELIPVAMELEKAANEALARRDKARNEILARLAQTGGKVLDGGDAIAQVDFQRQYEWNGELVREYAPEHVQYVPEEVILPHWKVRNTTALNNYITNLGKTEKAAALMSARKIKREVPKFKFSLVKPGDED